MLKYYGHAIGLAEFPDEIAICLNISNCPNKCPGCSEPWLAEDIGILLTDEELDHLISSYQDCSVFGLMGGDSDHEDVKRIAGYVHRNSNMKVGFYSGKDDIDEDLLSVLDYYKVGHWDKDRGPLSADTTNQIFYEINRGKLMDITYKFRLNCPKAHVL